VRDSVSLYRSVVEGTLVSLPSLWIFLTARIMASIFTLLGAKGSQIQSQDQGLPTFLAAPQNCDRRTSSWLMLLDSGIQGWMSFCPESPASERTTDLSLVTP
jgi:hypothetical protein